MEDSDDREMMAKDERGANREEWHRQFDAVLRSFDHHQPTPEQIEKIETLRAAAKTYAGHIMIQCPDSVDRSAALRRLRECNMTAIASIILQGKG